MTSETELDENLWGEDWLKEQNHAFSEGFRARGEQVVCIETDYESTVNAVLNRLSFDASKLSNRFSVRRMCEADAEDILALCLKNTQYYQYCGKQPTLELILNDLRVTPPGVTADAKYYVGFYDGAVLVAVMDLIVGYPDEASCFIGFFMMNRQLQGSGMGFGIIRDVCRYLRGAGFTSVLLGIDKGNPQSTHFWKKNGFQVIREVEQDGGTILVAEKTV